MVVNEKVFRGVCNVGCRWSSGDRWSRFRQQDAEGGGFCFVENAPSFSGI